MSDESVITRFHVGRTSGRVLSEVRRPTVHRLGEVPDRVRAEKPEPKAKAAPKVKPESNDADVDTSDG